jgi:hypothetical protein
MDRRPGAGPVSDPFPQPHEILGERWITPDEVVEIAGVKPWRVRDYPPIPKLRVGGTPRFRRSDAELWRRWEEYRATLLTGTQLAKRLDADPAAVRALLRSRAPWRDPWSDYGRRRDGPWVVLDGDTPKVDPADVERWRAELASEGLAMGPADCPAGYGRGALA